MLLESLLLILEEFEGIELEGVEVDVELITIIILAILFFGMIIARLAVKYFMD